MKHKGLTDEQFKELAAANVRKKIEEWEENIRVYESMRDRESSRYSVVDVVETERGFMLAYSGKPSTGPFGTKDEAMNWFLNGGR